MKKIIQIVNTVLLFLLVPIEHVFADFNRTAGAVSSPDIVSSGIKITRYLIIILAIPSLIFLVYFLIGFGRLNSSKSAKEKSKFKKKLIISVIFFLILLLLLVGLNFFERFLYL